MQTALLFLALVSSVSTSTLFFRSRVKSNTICPGGTVSCPSDYTCCEQSEGRYGCCPLPKATCCSDHVHCCPTGTKCDLKHTMCVAGQLSYEMVRRVQATPVGEVNVICPDHRSRCPSKTSCCIAGLVYRCCPFEKAVCCDDGKHCCPHNYKCDLKAKRCVHPGSESIAMARLPAAHERGSGSTQVALQVHPKNIVCPDLESDCPKGSTCCILPNKTYGCCFSPNAVCCADMKHCCPNGYTCDLVKHNCVWSGDAAQLSLVPIAVVSGHRASNVICPGGASQCAPKTTCCEQSSGWGCCPFNDAVCCEGGVHCCRHGQRCVAGGCDELGVTTSHTLVLPGSEASLTTWAVYCPGSKYHCMDGQTCCRMTDHSWGCCPLPNAVCCDDLVDCCPHDHVCAGHHTCTSGDRVVPASNKLPAHLRPGVSTNEKFISSSAKVKCPGSEFSCPSTNTCCKMASGDWACCPFENAVCCADKVHCCPHADQCSDSGCSAHSSARLSDHPSTDRTPDSPPDAVFTANKLTVPATPSLVSNICPGAGGVCHPNWTCCPLPTGYLCCSQPKAVCCADHLHCCPAGYTCNPPHGTCSKDGHPERVATNLTPVPHLPPWQRSGPFLPLRLMCPGRASSCQLEYTCCRWKYGGYKCCPHPNAVCCEDQQHCCEHGATCGPGGACQRYQILATDLSVVADSVECRDGSHCSVGSHACCPLPKAVCCSDGVHCCPNGYTCDGGYCTKGSLKIPLYTKTQGIIHHHKDNTVCPGGHVSCPSGKTCCKLASGKYGCCPLPQAVCCSDGVHCCPNGYTCAGGYCTKGSLKIPLYTKTPGVIQHPEYTNVQCPGGQYYCPSGNTCCKLASGQYGCCPVPQAVCCSDHKHCCPNGYTCDVSQGTCSNWSSQISLSTKISAITENLVCPDRTECPSEYTCCRLLSGLYGCCPLPDAVCCCDDIHCCPARYLCDVSEGSCIPQDNVIPAYTHQVLAHAELSVVTPIYSSSIKCLGGSLCAPGSTCCQVANHLYACCPISHAVCCGDFCCPAGYTCNLQHRRCDGSDYHIPGYTNHASTERTPRLSGISITCPDQSQCPQSNTCCRLLGGAYGCCAMPDAVCCSDGRHCCPHGFTCDPYRATCRLQTRTRQPKTIVASPLFTNVICPNNKTQCPSGYTCCMLKDKKYGCCPLPDAVCCVDGIHCCPHGSTCASGGCNKGDRVVPFRDNIAGREITQESDAPAYQKGSPSLHHGRDVAPSHVSGIICPDAESECPDGYTCCLMYTAKYGCCPLQMAVCCPDGVHCCPNGYICTNSGCSQGGRRVRFFMKTPAKQLSAKQAQKELDSAVQLHNVVCPGGEVVCSKGATCCRVKSGYGCCPLPKAVCCSDDVHCCPTGSKCDLKHLKCIKDGYSTRLVKKVSAVPVIAP